MNYYQHITCSAELRSMTAAQKAQSVLRSAAIPSAVIKLDGTQGRGCAYGVRFACNQKNNVSAILTKAGVTVKRWNTAD